MPSTTTTPSTREARYSPLKAHGSSSSSSPYKSRLSSPSPSKEGERPRKRRRGDDDEKEREVKKEEYVVQEPEQEKVELKRDPAYFFEDDTEARMYLQVEDFLFKIHRKKLYNSALFKERLKTFVGEGDSIGDPVLLNSTTADSFRLLLNVLYMSARPPPEEYGMEYTDDTACEAVSLWRTARIYAFADEESWAVRLVERVCRVPAFMDSCGSNTLREIVDCLAVSRSETLGFVERKWAERVRKQGTPSVPAIYAAEQYGLQHLGGVAYYQHVLDMLDRQHGDEDVKGNSNNNIPPRIRPDPKLTPDQIQRVLSGYMSLVTFWERFRRTPIPLPQGADCTQHDACKMNWERRWGSAIGWKRILGIGSADVLELIACLRDQLKGDEELKGGLETKCREAGLEALRVCLEEVREGLAGYFLGPIRTDI